MNARRPIILGIFMLVQFRDGLPEKSRVEISCGQTITENTILEADLACPPGTEYAIVIGASNINLDLGGHT